MVSIEKLLTRHPPGFIYKIVKNIIGN